MKQKTYIIISLIVLILLVVAFIVSVPVIKHNGVAEAEMEVLIAKKDKQAHIITQYSKIGLLSGNGNHCDIICIVFWKSEQSEDLTREHYSSEFYRADIIFSHEKDKLQNLISNFSLEGVEQKLMADNYSYLTYYNRSLLSNGDFRCF